MRAAPPTVLLLLVGTLACGGHARPNRPATDDHFRRMSLEEAAQTEAQTRATEAPCDAAPRHAEEACAAAARLCDVARRVTDADARRRCRRAEDGCRATRRATAARCGAGKGP